MTKKGAAKANFTAVKLLVVALAMAWTAPTLAQSASLSTRQQAPSAWSASGTLLQSKPFREELKPTTMIDTSVAYQVEKNQNHQSHLGLAVLYAHTWAEYKDKGNSQIESIDLSLKRSTNLGVGQPKLSYGTSVGLPANELDQDASFNSSLSVNGGLAWAIQKHTLSVSAEPTIYNYTYETANAEGDTYNKKFSFLATLGWSWSFSQRAAWRNSVSFFNYQNYADNTYQVYSFGTFLSYAVTKNVAVGGGVASKDRVITTNSVLADDITAMRIGLEWNL